GAGSVGRLPRCLRARSRGPSSYPDRRRRTWPWLALDLDVDAGRQVELHEGVQRLLGGLEDVEWPLVGADVELLTHLHVHVRAAEHGELVDPSRQRDRSRDPGASAPGGLDDLSCGLIQELRVVRLESDANLLSRHSSFVLDCKDGREDPCLGAARCPSMLLVVTELLRRRGALTSTGPACAQAHPRIGPGLFGLAGNDLTLG